MIITAKANGDVLNIKPSVFYQGSTEANRIYLIAPFAINSSVNIGFTLPNTNNIPVTLMTPSTVISDTLNTWVYDVPATLTQYVGIVKVNISITIPSGNIITLNRCQFEVKRGDEVVLPEEPEADVYATIVQALAQINADYINKVDISYIDTENEISQSIINSSLGLKLIKTVGNVTVTFEVTENGVEIDGIDIKEQVLNAVATANEAVATADNAESVALGIDAKASQALENSEEAISTANEAKAIALGIEQAKVFDTFEDMETWLKDEANKGLHTTGLELLIKSDDVPDYWVTAVLETPNADGYYYDIEENEASVLSVNGKKGVVVLKTDDISDTDQMNKWSTAEEKEKVSKIIIDGDGTLGLLNDGTYGVTGKVDSVNNVLPDTGTKNVTLTADNISDSTTTNKFATAEELAQIATNAEDIEDLQDLQDDKVDKVYSTDYAYTDGLVFSWKSDTSTYRVGTGTTTGGNGFTGTATEIVIPKYYDDGTNGIKLVDEIGQYAFVNRTSITSIKIPSSVTSIGVKAFYSCMNLTSITIPNRVTSIGNYTFSGCTSLTSITIGNSVTSIGVDAFYNCTSLTSITIPNSVTSIGTYAFRGCAGLTSITIPSRVTSIGEYAFGSCINLTSITIPNRVTRIGPSAFYNCSDLKSFTCLSTTPPILVSINTFIGTTTFIEVPKESLTAYKEATNWSTYADRIFAIPDGKWIEEELDIKVNTADIINNLMSTDTNKPLSALQGKNLKDILDTKNFGKAFNTISDMVSDLNSASSTDYRTAFNLLIVALEVPDFWITEIMASSVAYTYTTDQALIDAVGTEPVQIGFYKISKLETAKVDLSNYATTQSYTATLPSASWTGSSAPYSKEVTVSGILATDKLDIDLNLSSASYANIPTIQSAWFNVYRTVASADKITFYSHEIPSIDIPLTIKVVR